MSPFSLGLDEFETHTSARERQYSISLYIASKLRL